MPVYVDDMRAKFGTMIMCHMVADTIAELHEMADRIGVQRRWFQGPGKSRYPHYDISISKRALAIAFNAVEIRMRETPAIARRCLSSMQGSATPPSSNPAATSAAPNMLRPKY